MLISNTVRVIQRKKRIKVRAGLMITKLQAYPHAKSRTDLIAIHPKHPP